jgi:hypothetical protein
MLAAAPEGIMDKPLHLSSAEIARAFSDPATAAKFPPVLSLELAGELLIVPLGTMRDWRSRGRLAGCSRCVGNNLRIWRDRLLTQFFDGKLDG